LIGEFALCPRKSARTINISLLIRNMVMSKAERKALKKQQQAQLPGAAASQRPAKEAAQKAAAPGAPAEKTFDRARRKSSKDDAEDPELAKLRAELEALSVWKLRKRAGELGVPAAAIVAAAGESREKMVALLVALARASAAKAKREAEPRKFDMSRRGKAGGGVKAAADKAAADAVEAGVEVGLVLCGAAEAVRGADDSVAAYCPVPNMVNSDACPRPTTR
jgi:hypothetical protein